MSDDRNQIHSVEFETNKLSICLFSTKQQLSNLVAQLLSSDRYELNCFNSRLDLINFVSSDREQIDCIVLIEDAEVSTLLKHLWQLKILLPAIILKLEQPKKIAIEIDSLDNSSIHLVTDNIYHQAEIHLYSTQLAEIDSYINIAITKFVNLASGSNCDTPNDGTQHICQNLAVQQDRLSRKIKERLGYLAICDRRNPKVFYNNLSKSKQKKLEQKLISNYRQILVNYFDNNSQIKKLINEFVGQAFFNNVSTSQIIEIHMQLIDNFAYQLKLEGRNDDILLDYRLPLIDIMAHLCEMYRRSSSNEDISLELLFAVE